MDSRRVPTADKPAEPGWWLASNGLWYPPESAPAAATPTEPKPEPWGWNGPVAPPVPSAARYDEPRRPPTLGNHSGLATAALVLGIIALALFWALTWGLVLGPIAIVLGVAARMNRAGGGQIRVSEQPGIALGGLAFVLSIVFLFCLGLLVP